MCVNWTNSKVALEQENAFSLSQNIRCIKKIKECREDSSETKKNRTREKARQETKIASQVSVLYFTSDMFSIFTQQHKNLLWQNQPDSRFQSPLKLCCRPTFFTGFVCVMMEFKWNHLLFMFPFLFSVWRPLFLSVSVLSLSVCCRHKKI